MKAILSLLFLFGYLQTSGQSHDFSKLKKGSDGYYSFDFNFKKSGNYHVYILINGRPTLHYETMIGKL